MLPISKNSIFYLFKKNSNDLMINKNGKIRCFIYCIKVQGINRLKWKSALGFSELFTLVHDEIENKY